MCRKVQQQSLGIDVGADPNLETDFGQISHISYPDFLSDLSAISPEEQVLSEESDISLTDVSSLADENNDFSRIFHDIPDTSSGVSSLIDGDSADKDRLSSFQLIGRFAHKPDGGFEF